MARNVGHVTLGTSHDTSALACDSVRLCWERQGKAACPNAERLLVLCDGATCSRINCSGWPTT